MRFQNGILPWTSWTTSSFSIFSPRSSLSRKFCKGDYLGIFVFSLRCLFDFAFLLSSVRAYTYFSQHIPFFILSSFNYPCFYIFICPLAFKFILIHALARNEVYKSWVRMNPILLTYFLILVRINRSDHYITFFIEFFSHSVPVGFPLLAPSSIFAIKLYCIMSRKCL